MQREARRAFGIARSLVIYYGQPWRARRRRELYREFIGPGSLCFDVGAHVGNRIASWLALGARVVAAEPQPDLMAVLQLLYGRRLDVVLQRCALGERAGVASLHVSTATPTVSTLATGWIDEVRRDERFRSVRWDGRHEVEVDTLDRWVARHGEPDFCKIDVEGFELEVLKGLTHPLRALSFEYVPVAASRAIACVERLQALGRYQFRVSPGEAMRWGVDRWLGAEEICRWLRARGLRERSGDVYARRLM